MGNDDRIFERVAFWVIIGAAILTRLWGITTPPYAVFDEVYYATMANFYISATPFVDAHPPVARFIFALAALLGGSDGSGRFLTTGTPYGAFPYVWLRAVSGIAGIIFIALLMLFTHALTGSARAGLFAGFIAVFENALAAQSRVMLPDMFLLTFGVAGLLFAFYARGAKHAWLALAGIAFGLALGVKISGIIFIAAAFLFTIARPAWHASHAKLLAYFIILPFATLYALIFLHFTLLDANVPMLLSIGTGADGRYATIFNTLRATPSKTRAELFLQRAKEAVVEFTALPSSHLRSFKQHPAASPWFSWPVMYRPILYSYTLDGNSTRISALFGNPAIWWGGLIALITLVFRAVRGTSPRHTIFPLALAYTFALGLFAIASRELFLYLYLPALTFLVIALALFIDAIAATSKMAVALCCATIIAIFFFFAPFTYGLPLDARAAHQRRWLSSWNFTQQQ